VLAKITARKAVVWLVAAVAAAAAAAAAVVHTETVVAAAAVEKDSKVAGLKTPFRFFLRQMDWRASFQDNPGVAFEKCRVADSRHAASLQVVDEYRGSVVVVGVAFVVVDVAVAAGNVAVAGTAGVASSSFVAVEDSTVVDVLQTACRTYQFVAVVEKGCEEENLVASCVAAAPLRGRDSRCCTTTRSHRPRPAAWEAQVEQRERYSS
jgi:hypothetical protein